MLLPVDVFVDGLAFYARRRGFATRYDVAAIAEALAEARRLAAGKEIDEPAALFYACARRSRAFSGAAQQLVPFAVRVHAAAAGHDLTASDLVLEIFRARVLLDAIAWEELRDTFAAKLTPRG